MSNNIKKIIAGLLVLIILIGAGFGLVKVLKNKQDSKPVSKKTPEEEIEVIPEKSKKPASEDVLLRGNTFNLSKEEVKALEDKQHSSIYKEDDQYLVYEGVSALNDDFLLTYLFKDDKLIGILYELDTISEYRKTLAEKHQSISNAINKNYEGVEYSAQNTANWKGAERAYSSNIWNQAITNNELTMESIWNLGDYNVKLKTSKASDFDFLFSDSNELLEGNLYVLITPEANEKDAMAINPLLTQEQEDLKSGKVSPENSNQTTSTKEQGISIIKFNKAKQYVVIANQSDESKNLTGWYLTTKNKNRTYYFEDGFQIKPKEQILIYAANGKEELKSDSISRDFKWSDLPVFDEIQDSITLYNNDSISVSQAK